MWHGLVWCTKAFCFLIPVWIKTLNSPVGRDLVIIYINQIPLWPRIPSTAFLTSGLSVSAWIRLVSGNSLHWNYSRSWLFLEKLNWWKIPLKKRFHVCHLVIWNFLPSFCLLHACSVSSNSESLPTLCDPMDCSPPASSVHGMEPESPVSPALAGRLFTVELPGKPQFCLLDPHKMILSSIHNSPFNSF